MAESPLPNLWTSATNFENADKNEKTDVVEHPEVFDHVGLLVNEPPRPGRVALQLVIRRIQHKSLAEPVEISPSLHSLLLYGSEHVKQVGILLARSIMGILDR